VAEADAPGAPASAATRAPIRLQLVGIQYLRAIAALMVAYFHTVEQIPAYKPVFQAQLLGNLDLATGVDVFFVISGFIMLISNRNSTPAQFVLRRIIRVVPLYWVLTGVLAVLALLLPGLFRTTVVSAAYLAKSLFFIPYANPGHPGEMFPLLVPGWSLNFEMFFYAVFALCLFLPGRYRVPAVGALLLALVVCGHVPGAGRLGPVLHFYTDARVLEFWAGMLIANVLLGRPQWLPHRTAPLLVLGGFAALVTGLPAELVKLSGHLDNYGENLVPAAMIVLGMVGMERNGFVRPHRFLLWLGDASYSIYLSHIFSLGVARVAWNRAGLEQDGLAYAAGFGVFAICMILIGAWVAYTFVEKPLVALLQGALPGRRPPGVPPRDLPPENGGATR
jgi:exopolysaccharide production protein ExoZ